MLEQQENKPTEKEHIIDDVRSYFLKDWPEGVHLEQAYLHIGMYLGWIIEHDLYSEDFEEEFDVQIFRFKKRDLSCIIIGELWDGIISMDQFCLPEGCDFTDYYYAGGVYLQDYKEVFHCNEATMFDVEDSWENYEKMILKINERYEAWKAGA
ncbi:hypothetical protein [Algivirga pacifica]|uniref:DUF7832 domain-containing protein n=1 Tax=Algivirga pacifica TaxID=1162670 RepID=A0ABP9D1T9_9BACT